jgi:hypothetical protein
MDIDLFRRKPDTTAEETPQSHPDVVRAETTTTSDDGQQFRVWLLDADDSFDVVVQWPDGEREIVWSLVREREGQ